METKLAKLLALLVVLNLASAQKNPTEITGNVSRDKQTGTRFDLGVTHQRGKWELNGSGFATSRGHRGGEFGATHKGKNFDFGGSVSGDNRGNKKANVGFKWRLQRSLRMLMEKSH